MGLIGYHTLWRAVNRWYIKDDEIPCSGFDVQTVKSGVENLFYNGLKLIAVIGSAVVDANEYDSLRKSARIRGAHRMDYHRAFRPEPAAVS